MPANTIKTADVELRETDADNRGDERQTHIEDDPESIQGGTAEPVCTKHDDGPHERIVEVIMRQPGALPLLPGNPPPYVLPLFERLLRHTNHDPSTLSPQQLAMLTKLLTFPCSLVSPSTMQHATGMNMDGCRSVQQSLESGILAKTAITLYFDANKGWAMMGTIPE